MLYAIMAEDISNSGEKRKAARPAHLKRIEQLVADGRVVVAGPFPAIDSPEPGPSGVTGSLIVAEFDSLEDARAWIDADPYVTQGVFAKVSVKPFLKTVP
ncbi:MAG: YciI family protein [Betaproteobacteria bacterium]|nr:MAG: YciI family protein [Betaproteobacteria bacterium]